MWVWCVVHLLSSTTATLRLVLQMTFYKHQVFPCVKMYAHRQKQKTPKAEPKWLLLLIQLWLRHRMTFAAQQIHKRMLNGIWAQKNILQTTERGYTQSKEERRWRYSYYCRRDSIIFVYYQCQLYWHLFLLLQQCLQWLQTTTLWSLSTQQSNEDV